MADPAIPSAFRGLEFSATELRIQNPDWSEEMIEDYLSLLENLNILAAVVNQKQDLLRTVINITAADSPYDIGDTDQTLIFDTTLGEIEAILPRGVNGRTYRMTNVGSAGNKVTLTPDPLNDLFGTTEEFIYDAETLIMTFDEEQGWW